jgi:hypothetical protein
MLVRSSAVVIEDSTASRIGAGDNQLRSRHGNEPSSPVDVD